MALPKLEGLGRHCLWAAGGALLVGASAHLILVSPANVLGLVGGFACYFRALRHCETPREGLISGSVFGLLLAATTLSWLTDVLYVLTLGERIAGALVVGGFLGLIALPYGLWGLVGVFVRRRVPRRWLFLLAPGLLLAQALVHDVWLGFPWLHHGYWLAFGPLGNWLALLGAWGSGLLLLHLAACVGLWDTAPSTPQHALAATAILCLAPLFPVHPPPEATPRIVQAGIVSIEPPEVKDSAQDDFGLLSRYVLATQQLRAEWTFWPESVIRDGDATLAPLGATLGLPGRRVFAGALLAAPSGRYNALVELPSGRPLYYKQRLVPFSEYLPGEPFRWLFRVLGINTLKTDVSVAPQRQPSVEADGVSLHPLLCYEVAFTELIQPGPRPMVLLNAGNEGWFRSALMHRMTLAMSVARSREYGVPLVRSVVGGSSGIFDPASEPAWQGGEAREGTLTQSVRLQPRTAATPYSHWRRLLP